MEKRIEALAEFTGFEIENIRKADWGKFIFEAGNQEYMVLMSPFAVGVIIGKVFFPKQFAAFKW